MPLASTTSSYLVGVENPFSEIQLRRVADVGGNLIREKGLFAALRDRCKNLKCAINLASYPNPSNIFANHPA